MKKYSLIFFILIILMGCAKSPVYKDGVYEQRSEITDDKGGYGIVNLEVVGGKIVKCNFITYNADDSVKDETYGMKLNNPKLYDIAQNAVATCDIYADNLLEVQDLELVDAISGATINYDVFKNATSLILDNIEVVNK